MAAAAWAVVAAVVLWSTGSDAPPPWPWLATLEAAGGDKAVHALLFAVQAWLLCRCRPRPVGTAWLAVSLGIAVAYGVVTELGQLAVPGRDADPADALADVLGATVAVALFAGRGRPG